MLSGRVPGPRLAHWQSTCWLICFWQLEAPSVYFPSGKCQVAELFFYLTVRFPAGVGGDDPTDLLSLTGLTVLPWSCAAEQWHCSTCPSHLAPVPGHGGFLHSGTVWKQLYGSPTDYLASMTGLGQFSKAELSQFGIWE